MSPLLLALSIQTVDPAALIAVERARTAAEPHCVVDPDTTDITVCGLRHADRFRVPFATHAIARNDDVTAERTALLHENTPIENRGPFLVGGGMVGVSGGIGFGHGAGSGAVAAGGLRPIAP